ncbi:MAG: NHLP leader peptide family RiPP precursor [Proteobacteria bacterium]|nr:NHLP leader peptide family RiPP precursor [Pseudomonadota bacterium]
MTNAVLSAAEQQKAAAAYASVIRRAWTDPAYKARLLTDPHAVLADAGIYIAPDVSISVLENTPERQHLVLPEKPTAELSSAELDNVAAGFNMGGGGPKPANLRQVFDILQGTALPK